MFMAICGQHFMLSMQLVVSNNVNSLSLSLAYLLKNIKYCYISACWTISWQVKVLKIIKDLISFLKKNCLKVIPNHVLSCNNFTFYPSI